MLWLGSDRSSFAELRFYEAYDAAPIAKAEFWCQGSSFEWNFEDFFQDLLLGARAWGNESVH